MTENLRNQPVTIQPIKRTVVPVEAVDRGAAVRVEVHRVAPVTVQALGQRAVVREVRRGVDVPVDPATITSDLRKISGVPMELGMPVLPKVGEAAAQASEQVPTVASHEHMAVVAPQAERGHMS